MSQIVLGGGIGGLSAAFYLSKSLNAGIKLFESSNRVGGWIKSLKINDGTIFELGPKTLQNNGYKSESTLQLCEDIGLTSSIVPVLKSNPAYKNRYLYLKNQIVKVPNSFGSIFWVKPPYVRPLIYAFWKDYKAPKMELEDDSIHNFVSRRFGEDYADTLFSALTCGIFAGDSKEISVKSFLNDLFEKEQKFGGVLAGSMKSTKSLIPPTKKELMKWCSWSFKDGLETLPIQLKNYLQENKKAEICLEKKCSKLSFEKGVAVITIDDNMFVASHVYSALPSKELAKILGPEHKFLKTELSSIPYVHVGVVNLEYEGDLLKTKGFGILVPPNQNLPILGISFDSCILSLEGKTVLTVMMGGRWFEQYFGSNPEESSLLKTAIDHVKLTLNINQEPINSKVSILKNCIPQYVVGHSKKVANMRNYIAEKKLPLSLIGNAFDGVGIQDCILTAKKSVKKVLESTREQMYA